MTRGEPNKPEVCPICGSVLFRERKQFRQDDEPATLVVGCPIHGSAAELAVRFLSSTNDPGLHQQPSVRSLSVPIVQKHILPNIMPVISVDVLYAMRIEVAGDFHTEQRYYQVADIQCVIDGKVNHAQLHSLNPLWCEGRNTTVCKLQIMRDYSDPHAIYYEVPRYMSSYISEDIDGSMRMTRYSERLDLSTGVTIVLMKANQTRLRYSVWYTYNDACQKDAIDRIVSCMRHSLQRGMLRGCAIIADINLHAWHKKVRYMVQPNSSCVIYVPSNLLARSTQGEFIGGTGSFMHYYICRGICYAIDLREGTLTCITEDCIRSSTESPIVVSGYVSRKSITMEVVNCVDVLTWFLCGKSAIRYLVDTNECFVHTPVGTIDSWRSFIPQHQSTIRFQAVSDSDSRIDRRPNIVHHLISSSLLSFFTDTNQDIVFMYGKPRSEYNSILSVCRVCWIYDFNWDDENVTGFTNYPSVQHAFDTCAKFQRNVCRADDWLRYMEQNKCTICILDDVADGIVFENTDAYITLDKFIVCTGYTNHKFMIDASVDTTVFDLHTGSLSSVNSALADPVPISCRYVVCSQSLLPYMLSRMLDSVA